MIAVLGGALLALAMAPIARSVAMRLGMWDEPAGRRRHGARVPRGGGVAIGAAFLTVATALIAYVGADTLIGENPNAVVLLRGLLLGGGVALLVGWIDDLRDLAPGVQLAAQVGLALMAMSHSLWLQQFGHPLTGATVDLRADLAPGLGLLAVGAATIVWYAGFINTVNWLDGIDGLAASVGAVAAGLFAVHMLTAFDQRTLALFPLALAGACLGFLPWNMARARLFMGSSGSVFLGFTLAGLALITPAKVATALLVMAVPIVDVAWQILYRVRHNRSPWVGDRGHLHHRLFDRGWSPRAVVLLYSVLAAAIGGVGVLVPPSAPGRAQIKLAVLILVASCTIMGLWRLARDEGTTAA